MKKSLKIIGIAFFTLALAVSCDNDNDPSDDNLFVGTYNGSVSYTDPDSNTDISTDDGRVTVVKVGDSYNFDFSDGIPTLKDVEMEKNQNVLINSDGTISIDEGTLIIAFTKGGEIWGADCSR
ncbi:hypothetical protein RQM65_03730 [Pricia sp. S334]|uniref:Lipocalin-like domain-containing protein n=1 Tax=Pricia mediterranea TaxID=3076079 RepID=A0ABU3L214_9FLAO|nr:hypothetical protein [Pricia sp. S334]MDT7827774.1 hypothetical protein [Pricia sp. S334]